MKNNEFENIDNEIKVKENLSDESSDTIYKNRFRFKKNSIQIKKNSLLKTKIKNTNLEGTIINDSKLNNIVQFNNKDENISCIENGVITKDMQNEELKKFSMKNKENTKNKENAENTVVFTKLTSMQKKKSINDSDQNITNEIKNNKKKEKNVLIKNKHSDELNTSLNDKSSNNNTNTKSSLENISNLNKSKIDSQNNSIETINYNTTTDKTDESPLSLLKKHGKLIKYINEIHMNNSEEIINLRNDFSTIKSDLNKIMNIISISQKAVSSLK
ncbi:Drosophila melanogaster CG15040 gene product [Plasmodium yoelii yoelii]|uniref:Drosophila melanogaster CG15040 gene product n=1 Tax=Plasmodium yoelii yoelii TaxID=73239 RepID=Q7R9A9_PLAYO|nr:Drosophila melanogaster CG15040 gene product [Plasmodium yoelii yoelii]